MAIFLENGGMVERGVHTVFDSSTDEEDPDEEILVKSRCSSQTSIRLGDKRIRFASSHIVEIDMVKALCSYIGYAPRERGKDSIYFELGSEVNHKLFRVFKFEFVVWYMLLNHFLKQGDLKYESWDRYVKEIPFTTQRKDLFDDDEEKKCYRFGGYNSINITTTQHVAKLYRNSLIKFGKLRHMRCHNDNVAACLSSISYPGSENVDAARLSIFLRLNAEEKWRFVKLQLGWDF